MALVAALVDVLFQFNHFNGIVEKNYLGMKG